MTELKPCPFCGGKAKSRVDYKKETETYEWIVECIICSARTGFRKELEDAVEAWNRRANNGN